MSVVVFWQILFHCLVRTLPNVTLNCKMWTILMKWFSREQREINTYNNGKYAIQCRFDFSPSLAACWIARCYHHPRLHCLGFSSMYFISLMRNRIGKSIYKCPLPKCIFDGLCSNALKQKPKSMWHNLVFDDDQRTFPCVNHFLNWRVFFSNDAIHWRVLSSNQHW